MIHPSVHKFLGKAPLGTSERAVTEVKKEVKEEKNQEQIVTGQRTTGILKVNFDMSCNCDV